MSASIGIDLGTTNSCVGVWKNDQIQIVPNVMGNKTTPSVISFSKNELLIGNSAKNQITRNPENTIYDAKRLIGRNFSDEIVQKDKKFWPFKLKANKKDKPVISVKIKGEEKGLFPEQISALILKQLKKEAEDYLGKEVKNAVITVPAYFNNSQRQSTIDAGRIAGLNVIRTINEPTAAAIAYGYENKSNKERKVCIFDFGGGTFDVTVLIIKGNDFTVKSTGGDSHLGGQDIDNLLVKYFIKRFKELTNIDVSQNGKAKRRLKIVAEKTKILLSGIKESQIDIDCLAENEDYNDTLSVIDFNEICKDIFSKCIKILKETIKESKISKNEIDEIVLVGGSSRIPKIQEMIKESFGKKTKISKAINGDEAVAYGAALVASKNYIVSSEKNNILSNLNIKDVVPLSLGVGSKDHMIPMIKKNTNIPFTFRKTFKTIEDDATQFGIGIYEGESEFIKENNLLDAFYLKNITKAPKGETKMEITFHIDDNGILNVSAHEIGKKNNNQKIEVKIKREKRDEKEIEDLIKNGIVV